MTALAGLFNAGKAAVQLNVGPLVAPLTRTQFRSPDKYSYPRPPRLQSHNDQQSVWMSSSPEGATVGWGGRFADLAMSSNGNPLFSSVAIPGRSVFLVGNRAVGYQIGSDGAVALDGINGPKARFFYGSTNTANTVNTLIRQSRSHMLENEYNRVTARSLDAYEQVRGTLDAAPITTVFPAGSLGAQLKTVARLIGGRNVSGAKRQVFFVSIGGFDHHDNLMGLHPGLMATVSDAMAAFYNATVELGVADKVTAFTASEFGRTLSSNGNGSDHGWGSHHLVVGGGVKGAAFYGTAPPVSVGNTDAPEDQWHIGGGVLLPSTSVHQYSATLARWFGVADTEMDGVLPNLKNFNSAAYPRYLGFLG